MRIESWQCPFAPLDAILVFIHGFAGTESHSIKPLLTLRTPLATASMFADFPTSAAPRHNLACTPRRKHHVRELARSLSARSFQSFLQMMPEVLPHGRAA
jgi:hypothetical protein